MLTKDLLKVKTEKNRLKAVFVSPKDDDALAFAEKILEVSSSSEKLSQEEVESALKTEVQATMLPYAAGFSKIIQDQLEFEEPDQDLEAWRWEKICAAQDLREQHYYKDKESFQEAFAELYQETFPNLYSKMYSDLPEHRRLIKAPSIKPEKLIHRYNCGLVQALLLNSEYMQIDINFAGISEKRKLFRAIKFHRLIVGDISYDNHTLSFRADGPLSLLMHTNAYGMRMANFFPRLLFLKDWKMEAMINYKRKKYTLTLSDKDGLQSHYKDHGDYIPEEFLLFLEAFNKSTEDWKAEFSDEILSLTPQEFCFPDIKFLNPSSGKKIYLELFHRWHKNELLRRLKFLQKNKHIPMVLGACKSLESCIKNDFDAEQISELKKFLFTFRDLPTPKSLKPLWEWTFTNN